MPRDWTRWAPDTLGRTPVKRALGSYTHHSPPTGYFHLVDSPAMREGESVEEPQTSRQGGVEVRATLALMESHVLSRCFEFNGVRFPEPDPKLSPVVTGAATSHVLRRGRWRSSVENPAIA